MQWKFCPICAAELVERTENEAIRRVCSSCEFRHYDNPVPVVAAIVQHDDDVILARNHGWPDGWFGLVTGFLEKGESPEEGILRETTEELLVPARVESFVGLYLFEQMNQIIIAYHVVIEDEPSPGPELEAIRRVPIRKLRPWPMATGLAVADWLERVREGGES